MSPNANNFYVKYMMPLIGGKIEKIIVEPTEWDGTYMGIIVRKGKKTYEVVAQADEEGNGAGFLAINDVTDKIAKKPLDKTPVAE